MKLDIREGAVEDLKRLEEQVQKQDRRTQRMSSRRKHVTPVKAGLGNLPS